MAEFHSPAHTVHGKQVKEEFNLKLASVNYSTPNITIMLLS
jgi:hypothetical protein